jgi:hypothetical protein
MKLTGQIKRAYKKLKASVYYDKTQAVLKNEIVEFESNGIESIKSEFNELSKVLNGDDGTWNKYEEAILASIKALTLPKKLEENNRNKENKNPIISNGSNNNIEVSEEQYFIYMNIKGHLLGVLWILYVGKYIDADIYECSYGNRLDEKLMNEEKNKMEFSGILFKPYFSQYESWRDYALEKAQEYLKNSKDVVILTMDFKRFFYSVYFKEKMFQEYYNIYLKKSGESENDELCRIVQRLNGFVYKVLVKYSSLFKNKFEQHVFLPIGFLPSNILANQYLKKFDSAISNRWNPLYYGRYVDDIIIVDKVEKNSDLLNIVSSETVESREVIEYFLCNCNANKTNKCPQNAYSICNESNEKKYYINNIFLDNSKSKIEVKNDKMNVFYLMHNHTDAMITKFKKVIAMNKSEFRYLPEDDNILESNDCGEIFDIQYSDSINKLSGVKGVKIDKYELSKFIGKYLRMGGLITDNKESIFNENVLKIFDERVVIENYTLWEKVIEALIINNKLNILKDFILLILKSISDLKYKNSKGIISIQASLIKVLYTGICRGFSLSWGPEIEKCIKDICESVKKSNIKNISVVSKKFDYKEILKLRQGYCKTRMIDKNVMPALIDIIIEGNNFRMFNDKKKVNLTLFQDFMKNVEKFDFENIKYCYYPYKISPQELQLSSIYYDIKSYNESINKNSEKIIRNPEELLKVININYYKLNYNIRDNDHENQINEIDVKKLSKTEANQGTKKGNIFAIKVGNKLNKEKIKIALGNVKLDEKNFINVLTGSLCRSYERYKNLCAVVKEAIKNNADMLVLPEAYLPIEWLPIIMSISAKTQMAIITGIEHVVIDNSVYNFTATILPYTHDDFKFAYLNMHIKEVYSPEEKLTIEGYRYKCVEGENNELFVWNNLWFTVYCCFEFAAIEIRALFQSYVDLVVTVEWNHDVNYFNNIIESLNRDLHCYCIQVNTSDYGESRLIRPSKTENKDIIKIKGGVNSTAIIDEIDIKALRDFQIKEYGLQKSDKIFKPTPPFFNPEVVNKKRNGSLWNRIEYYGKLI